MQAARAAAIDDKAAELLRFNAVLLGILIAAVSLATERSGLLGSPPSGILAILFIAGLAGLAASTLLAVLSFRATDVRAGLKGTGAATKPSTRWGPSTRVEGSAP